MFGNNEDGNDTVVENAAEELGVATSDDTLRNIEMLLRVLVNEQVSGDSDSEWLSQDLDSDTGIYDQGDRSDAGVDEADYQSFNDTIDKQETRYRTSNVVETAVLHNVSDTVQIAFKDSDNDNRWIEVEPADSPFTFSGVNGASTKQVWVRVPPGAAYSTTDISLVLKFFDSVPSTT